MDRVVIFIDGSNLYHGLKADFGKTRVNVSSMVEKLVKDRHLIRTYYYTAPVTGIEDPEGAKEQQKFFGVLHDTPYVTIRLGKLVKRTKTFKCPKCQELITKDSFIQKGVDAYLVLDMLKLAKDNVYDVAVLVSGDGDLAEVVRAVKEVGKQVENAFTKYGWSRELQQASDKRISLDATFMEWCLLP
jgi:uncharacterized LabA/DUF88 family protein